MDIYESSLLGLYIYHFSLVLFIIHFYFVFLHLPIYLQDSCYVFYSAYSHVGSFQFFCVSVMVLICSILLKIWQLTLYFLPLSHFLFLEFLYLWFLVFAHRSRNFLFKIKDNFKKNFTFTIILISKYENFNMYFYQVLIYTDNHNQPKFIVYLRVHLWWCTLYVFGQRHNDIYQSL